MSSPNSNIEVVQSIGGKLSAALRESQKVVEENKFFLSSSNSKIAKYGFWAAAGAGVAVGLTFTAAAPVVAAIGIGVSAGVGVIGSSLERIAREREYLRQEHQQFIVQAKEFMTVLKAAYSDLKQEALEQQRSNTYHNADFFLYQESRQQLANQQSSELTAGSQVSADVKSHHDQGPRMG